MSFAHVPMAVLAMWSISSLGAEPGTTEDVAADEVNLNQTVHFDGPDGAPVAVPVGMYGVSSTGGESEGLLLDGADSSYDVRAVAYKHDRTIDVPMAITVEPDEDEFHVVLLRPDGTGLISVGSLSGVRSRAARRRAIAVAQPVKYKKSVQGALRRQRLYTVQGVPSRVPAPRMDLAIASIATKVTKTAGQAPRSQLRVNLKNRGNRPITGVSVQCTIGGHPFTGGTNAGAGPGYGWTLFAVSTQLLPLGEYDAQCEARMQPSGGSTPVDARVRNNTRHRQVRTAYGPDLAMTVPANGEVDVAGTFKVTNVGTEDAFFENASTLVSNSQIVPGPQWQIPAGGRIEPGQVVEMRTSGQHWMCPDSRTDPRQFAREPIEIDPNHVIAESDESNNLIRTYRANPFYLPPAEAAATSSASRKGDLVVTDVCEAYRNDAQITLRAKVKNASPYWLYQCPPGNSFPLYGAYMAGPRWFHVAGDNNHSGQSFNDHSFAWPPQAEVQIGANVEFGQTDSFGVTEGLGPGCHEVQVRIRPLEYAGWPKIKHESNTANNSARRFIEVGGASCVNPPASIVPPC